MSLVIFGTTCKLDNLATSFIVRYSPVSAIIQIMAAAESGRDLCYFTFQDPGHMDELYEMHQFLVEKDCTVGEYN